ncbi:MAG: hypothetical protein SF069_09765 [Phycisphaerae bacterium]|nr:hypothetical protein [Phycisphaerae bacterium]
MSNMNLGHNQLAEKLGDLHFTAEVRRLDQVLHGCGVESGATRSEILREYFSATGWMRRSECEPVEVDGRTYHPRIAFQPADGENELVVTDGYHNSARRFGVIESSPESPKTRRQEPNRWPVEFRWCGQCGACVPVFIKLAPPEQAILDGWLNAERGPFPSQIAAETGLSPGDAKMFRLHIRKPIAENGPSTSTPCPNCTRWLRTPNAQQCFHCGADWHPAEPG